MNAQYKYVSKYFEKLAEHTHDPPKAKVAPQAPDNTPSIDLSVNDVKMLQITVGIAAASLDQVIKGLAPSSSEFIDDDTLTLVLTALNTLKAHLPTNLQALVAGLSGRLSPGGGEGNGVIIQTGP